MTPTKEPARDSDPGSLHPVFRAIFYKLTQRFANEGLPFRLFEGRRSEERQAWLYASGRPQIPGGREGPIVTKAAPGLSYHQYGLAGDFVLFIDGKWSWDTSKVNAEKWRRLQELGVELGLEPLSFELPHLQVAGLKIADLKAGRLPQITKEIT